MTTNTGRGLYRWLFHRKGWHRHLPNGLTIIRILMALTMGALMVLGASPPWIPVLSLCAGAAATDGLDGWLARKLDARTRLGATLDPIADKILVATGLGGLALHAVLSGWDLIAAGIILAREVLVPTLRLFAAHRGHALPVTGLAKGKTVAQMAALLSLLAAAAWPETVPALPGRILLWLAAGLTFWTGIIYAVRAVAGPKDGRALPKH